MDSKGEAYVDFMRKNGGSPQVFVADNMRVTGWNICTLMETTDPTPGRATWWATESAILATNGQVYWFYNLRATRDDPEDRQNRKTLRLLDVEFECKKVVEAMKKHMDLLS